VFWINVPVGQFLLLAIVMVVPASEPEDAATRLDLVGAVFLVTSVMALIAGSALSKPLGTHLTRRQLAVVGLAAIAAGNVVLVITYGSIAGIVAGVVVAGTGLGVGSVAANAIGTDIADCLHGTATGLLNTGAQLGTAIGVAALVVLAATVYQPWPGTAIAWGLVAGIAAFAALPLLGKAKIARD
jgi:MFS family permease